MVFRDQNSPKEQVMACARVCLSVVTFLSSLSRNANLIIKGPSKRPSDKGTAESFTLHLETNRQQVKELCLPKQYFWGIIF